MKPTHFSHYMRFALLLAILCSSLIMNAGNEEYTKAPILKTQGFEIYQNESVAYTEMFATKLSISFEPAEESTLFVSYSFVSLPMGAYTDSGPYEEFSYYSNYLSYNNCYETFLVSRYYLTVNAYAVTDGKKPSSVVSQTFMIDWNNVADSYSGGGDLPYYIEDDGYKDYYYDFTLDGFYYKIINDSLFELVQGKVNHCIITHYEWWTSDGYISKDEYENNEEILYYVRDIVIPDSIFGSYNNFDDYLVYVEGNVGGIGYNAFNGCQDLHSVIIPESVLSINDSAFAKCGNIPYIELPVSVEYIGKNVFYGTGVAFMKLTGEGEWSGGALNVDVQRLDIASGITAIPGLQVNPREVYCYAKVPPTCDENTFTDYTGTLHVPESSLAAYFTAPYWCNFANIVGDAVELTDFTLNKDSVEIMEGEQLSLNAIIQPANASIDSIIWSSSNEEIATVVNGVVTANALGECDIIATCLDKRAICHVKVVEQIATITLNQHRASLLPNHILTLTPTVTPTGTDLVVTSSNPAVAAARFTGDKVQVVGVSVGTAIIKVASADNNAVADSCIVNVYTDAGDVDGDGFVKIDDVTTLIDYLLGSNSSIDMGNADIDYDGNVNIADVTALIDILLNGNISIPSRETFTVNGVSFTMIRVAPGTFMMGATEEQGSDAYDWEKPVHEVTLSSPYLIGETEVTQELWLAVMGSNPSKHLGSLQKPVENVTWPDCQEFISRLNQLTGMAFRLPTEAEWEYAARGANRSHGYKYAGSDNIAEVGNISSTTTLPVGLLQPNELYIYDMSGNVDEWVSDYWGNYTSGPQTNPTGPSSGTEHVYRSGSWYSGADVARVSYRYHRSNTFQRGTLGLRLAL